MLAGRINEEQPDQAIKLGLRDQKILSILSKNSRAPVSEIGRKLHINRDTVSYKIKRLQRLGLIKKFYAEVDLGRFGYTTCHVFFLLDQTNPEKQLAFMNGLMQNPHTKSVVEYNGIWDIEWVLTARSIEEFDYVVNQVSKNYSDIVVERDKLIVTKYFPTTKLPYRFYKDAGYKVNELPENKQTVKLDHKDFAILKLLAEDSRKNAVEIGREVNLSVDGTIKRIKNLQSTAVIPRFTILADKKKLDYNWYTVALQMRYFDSKHVHKLKEYVKEHPNIMRCVKTLGPWNFLLYLTTDNPFSFHKTVVELKKEFADVLKQCQTLAAYKEHCFFNFPNIISSQDLNKIPFTST